MQGLQAIYGIADENLWHAAAGFGGGISQAQDVCGAVTGGALAAGVALGRLGGAPADVRARTQPVVKQAYDGFVAKFGAADCRTLVGLDFSDPEQSRAFRKSTIKEERCTKFVRFMVETLGQAELERQAADS